MQVTFTSTAGLEAKESEAQKTANDRGYTLNPWTLHGKVLNEIHAAIADALTFKQYQAWTTGAPDTFRRRFEMVSKVSKNKLALSLADYGLKLVTRCEAIEAANKQKGA